MGVASGLSGPHETWVLQPSSRRPVGIGVAAACSASRRASQTTVGHIVGRTTIAAAHGLLLILPRLSPPGLPADAALAQSYRTSRVPFPLLLAFSSLCFSDRQHWPLLSPLFLRSLHVVYASNSPSHCNHHESDGPMVVRSSSTLEPDSSCSRVKRRQGWRGDDVD